MLELSRNLEIYSQESYRQKNKRSSDETELKFTSQHVDAGGKPIKIPDFFVIQLPLFDGGISERVLVRLRYRPTGEKGELVVRPVSRRHRSGKGLRKCL